MELLIINDCLVDYRDGKGAQHEATGTFIDVIAPDAKCLTTTGRALYVDAKDDPTKARQYTASDALVKAAKAAAAEAAKQPK